MTVGVALFVVAKATASEPPGAVAPAADWNEHTSSRSRTKRGRSSDLGIGIGNLTGAGAPADADAVPGMLGGSNIGSGGGSTGGSQPDVHAHAGSLDEENNRNRNMPRHDRATTSSNSV